MIQAAFASQLFTHNRTAKPRRRTAAVPTSPAAAAVPTVSWWQRLSAPVGHALHRRQAWT